jgi:flavin reductase (DIM6/NTAB) family NADH-FMN oxidoreductase RutF
VWSGSDVAKPRGEVEKSCWTCYKDPVLGADEFRQVLGHLPTGVTVVTTVDELGQPTGLTASAVASVSLHPPLVLVCVSQKAQSYPAMAAAGKFAVNVLALGQEPLSRRFATTAPGIEKFKDVGYRSGKLGLPILDGALASFECTVVHAYPGGDHTIFVGQVEAGAPGGNTHEPLLYYRGRYRRLDTAGDPA